MNNKRLIVSKSFKLKYVCLYNTIKKNVNINITLKSFCESIEDNDGILYIHKGEVKESTFRGWIEEVNNFTLQNLYDCTSYHNTKLQYKYKKKANKLLLKKLLTQFKTEYKEDFKKPKKNRKRNTYSTLFKLKWISIYKQYILKSKISLTNFTSYISGNNGYGVFIPCESITGSTFRKWLNTLN